MYLYILPVEIFNFLVNNLSMAINFSRVKTQENCNYS